MLFITLGERNILTIISIAIQCKVGIIMKAVNVPKEA